MLKKIASNTISQILSKVATAIISIFLISSLTKYLTPEMYWQYNKIYNYLSIFTFLADLWLYTISVREISKNKDLSEKIVWNVMSLRFILWIGVIVLSILIALFLPGYNTKVSLISIFIISIFSVFSLMNSSVLSLMQAYMKIEFSSLTFVLWKIVNLFLILWVVFIVFPKSETFSFDMAFILIMISWLLWIMVNFFLNFYYANKIVKVRLLFDIEYMKYLFKTSFAYWFALFLSVVYFKVDVILISLIETWTKADVSIALYSLPMKIIEVLMVIWMFFLNSILPSLSEYFKENKYEKLQILINNSFKFLFSFSFLIVIFWILFWKEMISIIATPDYIDKNIYTYTSYDAMFIVLFVLLFYFISSLFNYVFIASKNEKIILWVNIFITIFNIVWNIILIPKFSFIGSALVTLFSQIVLFWLLYYFSRKIVKINFDILYIFKVILFSIWIYFLWDYFLKNFGFWNIFDIFVYWIPITLIFVVFLFFINKKEYLDYKKDKVVIDNENLTI